MRNLKSGRRSYEDVDPFFPFNIERIATVNPLGWWKSVSQALSSAVREVLVGGSDFHSLGS